MIVRGTLGALAGSAAIGAAARVAANRNRRPKVLGVAIPRELIPTNLDPKKVAQRIEHIDLKKLAKQIGDAAEQIESRSDDVRLISAQARRLSRKLS